MKCSKCKEKDAVIYLGYLKGKSRESQSFCESCLAAMGISPHLLHSTPESENPIEKSSFSVKYQLKCPRCGMEILDFLNSGQIGCSLCYQVFKGEIKEFFRLDSDEYSLNRKLKDAVDDENYEYAATLRDRIRILSSGEVNELIEN